MNLDLKSEPSLKEGKGYLWVYFTGEGEGAEAINMALSKENDALDWYTLNEGDPIIISTKGEEGLRDPFIIRSFDGKKFYLIATDLKIHNRLGDGFKDAQINGSHFIEIFESSDLISWSQQRHVEISSELAGNTWAPKAFWDQGLEKYIVFWASNLYEERDVNKRKDVTYNRMMYVTTKDFYSFSKPQIWVDVNLGKGKGTIDATVVKEGEWYYRFMKEESTMTIRLERTKNLYAVTNGQSYSSKDASEQEWCTLGEKLGVGLPNGEGKLFTSGEGPCIIRTNQTDINAFKWLLFIDQPFYHGGPNHYVGFGSNDLSDVHSWQPVSDKLRKGLPQNKKGEKPRHGSIIALNEKEYDLIYQTYLNKK